MPYLNDPELKSISPRIITGFELAIEEERWANTHAFYHLGQSALILGAVLRCHVPITESDPDNHISVHLWYSLPGTPLIEYEYGSARNKYLIFLNHASDDQLKLLRLIVKAYAL